MSITVSTLGFPRIGHHRELKKSLERHWSGETDAEMLLRDAAHLRKTNWSLQSAAGVTHIPSNDFSLYDHVLDTSALVGAVPDLYEWKGGMVPLDIYFAMARGTRSRPGGDLPALAMTKWFDTNYHYMIPEFKPAQTFTLASTKPIDQFVEAKELGFHTRPVLVGPVTYLLLGRTGETPFDPLSLLPGLLDVYVEVLKRLTAAGADWVQLDEPCLALDLNDAARAALRTAYQRLAKAVPAARIMLTPYFGALGDNLETALGLPVAGLHLDLKRAPGELADVVARAPKDLTLSLGVIDGRNVWRADLAGILDRIEPVVEKLSPERAIISPSCSLLHVPIDLDLETDLDADARGWMSFATQKIEEMAVLARALNDGRDAVKDRLMAATQAAASRRASGRIHNEAVKARAARTSPDMWRRTGDLKERQLAQRAALKLPAFPTTTIGSFPQTDMVREIRAARAKGTLSDAVYDDLLRAETQTAVRWQEEIDLDVLVHGEFERNDMVQYFGEQLSGYMFTKHGWVQSYGSRYVRPPIIYGDVTRPEPMTVKWSSYAQSLTKRPMKGMLTGPVTMLQWSFVRDDQSRADTCRQIALALRDEVRDLERAGIRIIQIDEPALREGLPLRRSDWQPYLDWATECFRLTASGVRIDTQIHTHMCYSDFNDIIDSIAALDADVISIETARSKMELLNAFKSYRYPSDIGPGVYDIHAPRLPSVGEMMGLLSSASEWIPVEQLWVNPDCGLKTRKWDEVRPALVNMVAAAKQARVTVR
jgi:5-methyltetrahydropteroyltriglutamate--homocysteine methyltransferase